MDTMEIDRFIERYTEERKHAPRQIALQHVQSYAYMICTTGDVELFLRQARAVLVYNIDSLSLFDNPFRNSQICWLLFVPLWFAFSLHLTTDQDLALVGLINCAGTMIYGTSLFINVMGRWLDTCIQISYYREMIDFIDSQQHPPATETVVCPPLLMTAGST